MEDVYYTDHADVIKLCRVAYPSYNGKKFRVKISSYPISVRGSWDGGSKSSFVFVNLSTGATMPVPAQSAFDAPIAGADAVPLTPGMACVKHDIFCGKDMGCTVLVHPDNAPKYLPIKVELSADEKTVLKCTKSYKSSYMGRANNRLYEAQLSTDITPERWEAAKASCISRGLLNKAGAITNEGRNSL